MYDLIRIGTRKMTVFSKRQNMFFPLLAQLVISYIVDKKGAHQKVEYIFSEL